MADLKTPRKPKGLGNRLVETYTTVARKVVGAPSVRTESSQSASKRIRSWISHAVEDGTLPGAVILIAKEGEIVLEEAIGYRDIEAGKRHRMNDLFFLASATKPLAATAVLSLVDRDELSLDDSLLNFVPELGRARLESGERVRSPTLRELLSHTAGTFGQLGATPEQQKLVWNVDGTIREAASSIASEPFVFTPGEGFGYGGASLTVAASIAEIAADKPFDFLAHDAIFKPLGMKDTYYRYDETEKNRMAIVYQAASKGLIRRARQPYETFEHFVLAPGGLNSTARDLHTFVELHINNGVHHNRRLLSEDLIWEARQDQTNRYFDSIRSTGNRWNSAWIGDCQGYGFGWILDELGADGSARVLLHGGSTGSLLWGDVKDKLAIVMLSHVRLSRVSRLWSEIIKLSRGYWGTAPSPKPASLVPKQTRRDKLRKRAAALEPPQQTIRPGPKPPSSDSTPSEMTTDDRLVDGVDRLPSPPKSRTDIRPLRPTPAKKSKRKIAEKTTEFRPTHPAKTPLGNATELAEQGADPASSDTTTKDAADQAPAAKHRDSDVRIQLDRWRAMRRTSKRRRSGEQATPKPKDPAAISTLRKTRRKKA